MINQQILDYIAKQLQIGESVENINNNLLSSGWQQADINEAFGQLSVNANSLVANDLTKENQESPKNDKKAGLGLILGIVSLITWLLPIIGAPIAVTGLIISILGLKSNKQTKAIIGIVLCSMGLIATVINAALGAYLGVTGQHSVVNKYFGEENQELTEQNLITTTPSVGSDTLKAEYIKQAVAGIKAEMTLPHQVDEFTTIVDITAGPSAIRYHYIISGIDTNLMTNKILKEGLLELGCKDENISGILDEDISLEYSYSVEDSPQKYFVSVTKEDCQ